jgi:hypothetical protein
MLNYPEQTRTENNRLSGIPCHGLVLHKTLKLGCFYSTCQVCQMLKKDQRRNKYGLLPPKIAESDIVSLGHSLCVCGGSIYNKDTSQNTVSNHLPSLTMIHPATGWFEIVVATNKSATSIQDLCHNTWLAPYPRP